MNNLVVMKFGGTSVEDDCAIRNVAQIILNERRAKLVVVSACAGVTDSLIETAQIASVRETERALSIAFSLHERHVEVASRLLSEINAEPVIDILNSELSGLRNVLHSISVLGELSPRSLDYILNFGERWSSLLLSRFLLQCGAPVELFPAGKVIITDSGFNRAAPLLNRIEVLAEQHLIPLLQQSIVVTQGFIGATADGIPVTIGRGGSDYSAAIFGAALEANEIQIWTDVDGILTADPAVLPDARPIRELTFDEAAELAYFGAKVLHPSTILPAVRKDIPVRVLNSRKPDCEGTIIRNSKSENGHCVVKSIAYKEGITVITVKSSEMLMAHGFLARLFTVFERYKKAIDVIATAKVSVSLTLDDDADLEAIVDEIREFAEVSLENQKAVFCVVGENMRSTRGIAARVFAPLDAAGVNVDLISNGASKINLTFVVNETEIGTAVRALHNEFFSST